MTPQKTKDSGSPQSTTAPTVAATSTAKRKPWIKRSPVEAFIAQIDRAREDVAKKKEEYETAKRQFEKLEAARKVLEGT